MALSVAQHAQQAKTFLREVRQELKAVQWPSRRSTVRFTTLIIVASAAVAVAVGVFDTVLTMLVERFLLR